MKERMKRILAALLCSATLLSFAGCDSKGSDTGASTTEGDVTTTEVPGTDDPSPAGLFTDEQLASFAALIAKYDERARVIAGETQNAYMTTDRAGNITLARYYTVLSRRPGTSDVSSVWHYGAFLSMASHMIAIADSDEEKTEAINLYENLVKSMDFYKGSASVTTYTGTTRVTYYGVNRGASKGGANVANELAVYDDQMWLIMDLMDAYAFTGTESYMKEAVRLADICLAGWDFSTDANGNEYGGIPWGYVYLTKHTCSNAPIVSPLVDISNAYAAKGDSEKAEYYLTWAKKVYDWTYTHLQNSSGVYGDLLGTSRTQEGNKYVTTSQSTSIDQTAYTYNSGTMLSGAAALYQATGDESYLEQAEKLAKQTQRVFRSGRGAVDSYPITSDTVWFNYILFQGYVDLVIAELDRAIATGNKTNIKTCLGYVESMRDSIDYAYDNHLKDGFLPRDFVNGWDEKSGFDQNKNIMDQASAAETFALLSMFYEKLIEFNRLFTAS